MAARTINVAALREKLVSTTNGIEAHRLLRKAERADRDTAVEVLKAYAGDGPLHHVRTHAASRLAELVSDRDTGFANFFEAGLSDPHLAYWSVEGLVRVLGPSSFPTLARFAMDTSHTVEERGKAIREMGLLSGQTFLRGLPSDPGHWKEEDLPIQALKKWADAGFPPGLGFAPPQRHPRLDAPENALDRIAGKLEVKLAKLRKAQQDPVNPSDWLAPASDADLAGVKAKWPLLPSTYVEFLRHFSPLHVNIVSRKYFQGLDLHGASELIAAQDGYAFNPILGQPISDWPQQFVVIANHAGDPYVLDLSQSRDCDAPVLTAMHGEGDWDFTKEAASFLAFLQRLAR